MAANIARQTAIKMRVDAIVVLIGFVFERRIMPISTDCSISYAEPEASKSVAPFRRSERRIAPVRIPR